MNDLQKITSGKGFIVRPFQNDDAVQVAQLVTESVKGHWTYKPEQFRESDDPKRCRLVAEQSGKVVATANSSPFGEGASNALRLDLAGQEDAFTPLYLSILAQCPAQKRILGVMREDFTSQMRFFYNAGFRNAWQSWGAHLDLSLFDYERFQPLEEKLYLQGYEVEHLTKAAAEVDWATLYQLYVQGIEDAPRNPTTTPPFYTQESLKEVLLEGEVFVIRHKKQIVAMTQMARQDQEIESKHTVTHSEHRNQGLATLMKASALAWAHQHSFVKAGTGGTVLNIPMLRVNTRLGYLVEKMWITWELIVH